MKDRSKNSSPFDAQTFSSVLGQAVWLMTMSNEHRSLPISEIENRVAPAVLLRQFKLFSKGKQPIAFVTWALVSDEVKSRFDEGGKLDDIKDWRSGSNLTVVDCVTPFAPREQIIEEFMNSVRSKSAHDS